MKAIARTIRITPKKANLVAGMIRKKSTEQALDILKYTPKKAAKILQKLLNSAVANATNNFKQDKKSLFISQIIVTKGPTLKRSVPVSRGRAHPILKRTSHITIELGLITATPKTEKDEKTKKLTAPKEKIPTKKSI